MSDPTYRRECFARAVAWRSLLTGAFLALFVASVMVLLP